MHSDEAAGHRPKRSHAIATSFPSSTHPDRGPWEPAIRLPMPARPDEELVQHARALRGIARALVDADDADDVFQEAATQALQRPPTQSTSMFGWLSGVVRNRARKHHESARRRQSREQVVGERTLANTNAPPSPLAAAVHRETIARLAQALLALAQPYQDTVLLRYYEGLTPQQIAERTNTSLATVKSRLARGLALLRERLDADDRGGPGWRPAFAVAFGMHQQAGVASIATLGILLMASKLMLAAIVAVVLALWLWPFGEALPPAPVSQRSAQAAQKVGADAASDAAITKSNREAVASEVAPEEPGTLPADGVTFAGRCIDELGVPLADVHIVARTRARDGGRALADIKLTTGSDGTFVVTLPIADKHYQNLLLTAEGRCEVAGSKHEATAGERLELGDVVVPFARRLRGVVVDEQGTAQSGIAVQLYRSRDQGDSRRVLDVFMPSSPVVTDSSGAFAFQHTLAPGSYQLGLNNRALVDKNAARLDLTDEPFFRELCLVVGPPPPACKGIVVRNDGSPIARARVSLGDASTSTGPDGRFSLQPNPNHGTGPRRVDCSADGFQRHAGVTWPYGDPAEVRIVLRPNVAIIVRAIDGRTGRPLERYSARIVQPNGWSGGFEPATTHPGGTCRIDAAVGDYFVIVRPEQEELQESCFVSATLSSDGDTEVTITLSPVQQRRIVVTDDGQPVAGVNVQLLDPGTTTVRLHTETWPLDEAPLSGPPLVRILQEVTTDDAGTAQLRGPKGPLALRLTGEQRAPRIVQPIVLDGDGDLVVEMPRGATLRGRLVPQRVALALLAAAEPKPNVKTEPFGIELISSNFETMHRFFDLPFACEPDGTFTIVGIPEGTWHVRVGTNRRGYAACKVVLRNEETLEQDVDVSALEPVEINLRILVDGSPAADAFVNCLAQHAIDSFGNRSGGGSRGRTDSEGRFSFITQVGDFDVHLSCKTKAGESMRLMPHFRVDRPGAQEILLDLHTGSLDLTLLQPDGTPAVGVPIREQGRPYGDSWQTDQAGRLFLEHSLVGTQALEVRPRSLTSNEQRNAFSRQNGYQTLEREFVTIGTITVLPGAAVPQTITLPASWDR